MYLFCPLIQAKDPRIEVFSDSVYFTDLKERDDGTYSISIDEDRQYDVIRLKILGENITLYCIFKGSAPSENSGENRYFY